MITTYKFSKGGWWGNLLLGIKNGNRHNWFTIAKLPTDVLQKYSQYVAEGKGLPGENYRGPMMIVAKIEEEIEKREKRQEARQEKLRRQQDLFPDSTNAIKMEPLLEKEFVNHVNAIMEEKKNKNESQHLETEKRYKTPEKMISRSQSLVQSSTRLNKKKQVLVKKGANFKIMEEKDSGKKIHSGHKKNIEKGYKAPVKMQTRREGLVTVNTNGSGK